jgi:hypothetical protein
MLNEHFLQNHPTSEVSVVTLCLRDGGLLEAPKTVGGSSAATLQDQLFLQVSGLDIAGLAESRFGEKLLYVREEVSVLFDFLISSSRTKLVEGPPGSGKSSATWAWACQKAETTASVLWAHVQKGGGAVVATLSEKTVKVVGTLPLSKLIGVISKTTVDIVVLDGIVGNNERIQSLLDEAASWVTWGPERRVVQVTSESFTIPIEQLMSSNTTEHRVTSWTFEQYTAAIHSADFFAQIDGCFGDEETMEDKMGNKFFLAGGCARWMFGVTIDEASADIEKHLDRVNDKVLLVSGMQGAKAVGSVNHLVQRLKSGTFLVSEFVARQLAETCEKAFVVQATSQAMRLGNPSFDGWVLEMDFMMQLRLACENGTSIKVNVMDTTEEEWAVPLRVLFNNPNDLVGDVISQDGVQVHHNKLNVVDYAWLVPKHWNQGAYDAAQVLPNSIRFVQVTRGQTHSLKLQYMRTLIAALVQIGRLVLTVEVVFVVPEGRCDNFTLGQVTAQLGDWNWSPEQRRVAGFARSRA